MKKDKKSKINIKYITAFDPIIKKKVLFIVRNGWAISVITGHKFKYKG